jgi:hypothetical protein
MMGLLTGHSNKRTLHKLSLVNSPEASEMAACVFCDCEALAALGFRHLGQHFVKLDDLEEISVSRKLHVV